MKTEMTEETAKQLCEAFNSTIINSEKFAETSEKALYLIVQNTYLKLQDKILYLSDKVVHANIFTRWYWNIKYKKTLVKIKAIESSSEIMAIIKQNTVKNNTKL